ncbi:hypothetical protein N7488_000155 [Penicillium malachiteum]|nr:hypothetical protein N7488_000155 [Penicillium malachiteum]
MTEPKLRLLFFEAETPSAAIMKPMFTTKTTALPQKHHCTPSLHSGVNFVSGEFSRSLSARKSEGISTFAGASREKSTSETEDLELECLNFQSKA